VSSAATASYASNCECNAISYVFDMLCSFKVALNTHTDLRVDAPVKLWTTMPSPAAGRFQGEHRYPGRRCAPPTPPSAATPEVVN
jgi:hypothetical protein